LAAKKKFGKYFFGVREISGNFFFEGKSVHALTHKTELSPTTQPPNYPKTWKNHPYPEFSDVIVIAGNRGLPAAFLALF
jgi:hypothetical protein